MTNIDHLRDRSVDFDASTVVLTEYCRQRIVAWNVACHDPAHPAQLTHYVEPHYSWLKDSSAKVLDSSRRSTVATEKGHRLADEFEPVAAPGDDATTELAKLIEGSRLICLSEDAGAGKTVFTRRLEAFVSSPWARNKLFDDQPQFAARFESWPTAFDDRLYKDLGTILQSNCRQFSSLTPHDVARWTLEHGRVVLILDALDQVTSKRQVRRLQAFLESPLGQGCRVVLTSRGYRVQELRDSLFHLPGWRFARIDDFDEVQQYQYLADILEQVDREIPKVELTGDAIVDRVRCRDRLNAFFPSYGDVAGVLRVPVALALLRHLAERGRQCPFRTRGELYLQADAELWPRAAEKLGLPATLQRFARWRRIVATTAFQMMVDRAWDYRVEGPKSVDRLHGEAGSHCCPHVKPAEWDEIGRVCAISDQFILEHADEGRFAFRHRGTMEFYCALHMADNLQQGWVRRRTIAAGAEPEVYGGDEHLQQSIHDRNWYWAWRMAAELPNRVDPATDDRVFDPEVLCATLGRLIEPQGGTPWPTELIYRAWHRFEVDELVLARFAWTDSDGWPIVGESLRERGRSLLLPGAAAVMRRYRRRLKKLLEPFVEGWLDEAAHERCRIARELMAGFVPCRPMELEGGERPTVGGDEHTKHPLVVRPFEIMSDAVTREQFALFDAVRSGQLPQGPVLDSAAGPRCPVVGVTWFDAFAFSKWLGPEYRLPTEAEQECARRAGNLHPLQGDDREWYWDGQDDLPVLGGGNGYLSTNHDVLIGFRVVRTP